METTNRQAQGHLFRKQALEFVNGRLYGNVTIATRPSNVYLAVGFSCIVGCLAAFLFLSSATRKVQCWGVLLPTAGIVKIVAPASGTVVKSKLIEGRNVRAGEVLAEISNERSSSATSSVGQIVSLLMKERLRTYLDDLVVTEALSRERTSNQSQKIDALRADLVRIRAQIALQRSRIELSDDTQRRYGRLREQGFISYDYFRDKLSDLLEQKQRLAELDRREASVLSDLTSAMSLLRDINLESRRQILSIRRNIGLVKQELSENDVRREIVVRAPRSGLITAPTSQLGQTVQENLTLASLIPVDSALQAEIYASSRSAGFIKPGMKVLLRYQAYPYQKFGQHSASVIEVARTAVSPSELPFGAGVGSPGEPMYRVRLALEKQTITAYGTDIRLKSGMLFDASVIVDRRYLYEWILDPLFSISGRL